MDEEFEIVDKVFCRLVDQKTNNDLEQIVIDIWHSSGLIRGGGLHNYVGEAADINKVIDSYSFIGQSQCSNCIAKAKEYWEKYSSGKPESDLDCDDFREIFDSQLDDLEETFYNSEEKIIQALVQFVQKNKLNG
ncbi:MAG: hypothetical protein C0621_07220 [Desulfuromonas sp.]|nr:MAG: hypothetical protein C0621_07220 [Desulfuromonas sp.]